jgi:hypothetical protein
MGFENARDGLKDSICHSVDLLVAHRDPQIGLGVKRGTSFQERV